MIINDGLMGSNPGVGKRMEILGKNIMSLLVRDSTNSTGCKCRTQIGNGVSEVVGS